MLSVGYNCASYGNIEELLLIVCSKTKHKDLVRHGKLSSTKFTCYLAPFKVLSQETNQSDYKIVAKTKGGSNEMMTGK